MIPLFKPSAKPRSRPERVAAGSFIGIAGRGIEHHRVRCLGSQACPRRLATCENCRNDSEIGSHSQDASVLTSVSAVGMAGCGFLSSRGNIWEQFTIALAFGTFGLMFASLGIVAIYCVKVRFDPARLSVAGRPSRTRSLSPCHLSSSMLTARLFIGFASLPPNNSARSAANAFTPATTWKPTFTCPTLLSWVND